MASKRNKIYKNKTKRNKDLKVSIMPKINKHHKDLLCKDYFNSYYTFEDKFQKEVDKEYLLSNRASIDKKFIESVSKAISDTGVQAKDDFYTYVNEKLIRDTKLAHYQKYIVQVDDFRLVQDKVYRELLEIVKEYIKDNDTKKAKEISCFYHAALKMNTNTQMKDYAKKRLEEIDEYRKDKKNLWKILGHFNKNEMISWGCPFTWTLNPDDKNPKIFESYVESGQLTLIDLNLYLDDGTDVEYKRKYIKRYIEYLNKVFELSFGENHGFNVKDIYDIESEIFLQIGCEAFPNKKFTNYNRITRKEAVEVYGFDWDEFAKELGFDSVPDFFITSNPNFLKCGTDMLKDWNSEKWRTYWIYLYIRQMERFNYDGLMNFFEFQGKYVRGQEAPVERSLYPIYGLGYAFNTFLTNEYIDRYENKQHIEYVKAMATDLKSVFIRIIERNKWLQPQTKKLALKKLYHFNLDVGSPKILREDPLLNYSDDDYWGNLLKISFWRHKKAVELNSKPVVDIPVIDWANIPPKFIGTQAYVVNAAYTPSKNGIYIPLGYIQKPFIDLDERGIEYNLAHLGFTLAHEMSHSLDDWGSQYDYKGRLSDWWTPEDKKKYKLIQDDVIKQYESFALQDGIHFDASIGIGEDLADISGLNICREFLRDFQEYNKDIIPIRVLSFQMFFIYFAYQMRQKISKKAIEAQLKTNPHPLDKYRTNVPLSRIPLFRSIYKVKKGDKMYWHSMNRVWQS